jgi:PX domain-containing protein kinase-like protein
MNGIRTSVDDTLPITCVIESSQLVEGHGVINKNKFFFLIIIKNQN